MKNQKNNDLYTDGSRNCKDCSDSTKNCSDSAKNCSDTRDSKSTKACGRNDAKDCK